MQGKLLSFADDLLILKVDMFKHDKIAVNAHDLVLTIIEVLYGALIDSEWVFESHHTCLLNFINH